MSAFSKILAAITGKPDQDPAPEPLNEGASIPAVTQRNQDENPIPLAEFGANGYLLVYFYPKADTPGCTKQACSLRDAFAELSDRGVKVLGVSIDSPAAQQSFRKKFNLPFDLLADEDGTVIEALGVPKMMGHSKRQAFLFKDGTLVWRDLSASTAEQAADILKFV